MIRFIGFFFIFVTTQHYGQVGCDNAPDLLVYNAIIYTMDAKLPLANAMVIKNGEIIEIGTEQAMEKYFEAGCAFDIMDALGKVILPGFNDSHCHWFSWREHICEIPGHESYTTYPSLEEIMLELSKNGWTSISELNFGHPERIPEHLENALDLDSRGLLNVRVNGYWGTYDGPEFIDELENIGIEPGMKFSDHVRVPGVKIYVDGPFGTRNILTLDQTKELVYRAHTGGWSVAAHTVNESAMEMIILAFEEVLGKEDNFLMRHRIEHAVKVNDDQMNRIKDKGLIASFQLMGPPDWPEQETFRNNISNENPQYCLRWKDFFDHNLMLTGSTDAPFNNSVCDYSPFRVVHQAITREGYLNRNHADWETAQKLDIYQAIEALTSRGAYATGEEEVKGTLTEGKYADFVVISKDPFTLERQNDLLDLFTVQTYLGGQNVFDHNQNKGEIRAVPYYKVDSIIITSSKYLESENPGLAFDQNPETQWGSGDFSPQWIQFDLRRDTRLENIQLITAQFPQGITSHQILARKNMDPSGYQLVHIFNTFTNDNDTLTYAFNEEQTYRYFRIFTTASPSWVSWKEVIFNGSKITKTVNLNNLTTPHIYPQPAQDNLTIELKNMIVAGEMKIYDVKGNLIMENTIYNSKQIEVRIPEVLPGVYFIVINGQGRNLHQRIIIQ